MAPSVNKTKAKAKAKASALPADAAPAGDMISSWKPAQAQKAVKALLQYATKQAEAAEDSELLGRDEHVWLSVNTKSGSTRKKLMPVKIQLPTPPLPPPPATSVCLLVKDPQREYKDLIAKHDIKFIDRVVGVQKLKGKFKPFEPRRQLRNDHDLFLVDDRVLPLMPKLLGKMFFEAKKQPIPVNLQRKDLKQELGRAIASTYFHPTTGTSHSVRIATVGVSTPEQVMANLTAAVPAAVALVGGWDNVLSVGIKTSKSILLPVWNAKLPGRFTDAAAADADEAMKEDEEEQAKPVAKKAAKAAAPKADKPVKEKTAKAAGTTLGDKKKSSTIGSGAKKAKAAAVGSSKSKAKPKAK